MRLLKGFGRFWYDVVIGDDWKIAAAVVVALALATVVLLTGVLGATGAAVAGAVTLAVLFVLSVVVDVRRS
jgi:hypothetical protein